MASSSTDIANLALGHLGEARINSLDDDNVAARACVLHYETTRDELLRSHRWNFATDRKVLTALADGPAFNYTYQFELPSNFLRALEINDTEIGDVLSDVYVIEGGKLLTDQDAVNLLYIKQVTNVGLFDPMFVKVFAMKLAIEIAPVIRGSTAITAELEMKLERVFGPRARRVDANEGRRRKGLLPMNSNAVRARGNSVDTMAPNVHRYSSYDPWA